MGLNKMSQRGHRLSIPTTSTRVTNSNKRGKKRILLVDDEPDMDEIVQKETIEP
jgi:hypothetical protein